MRLSVAAAALVSSLLACPSQSFVPNNGRAFMQHVSQQNVVADVLATGLFMSTAETESEIEKPKEETYQ